jgi:hypothetical protein
MRAQIAYVDPRQPRTHGMVRARIPAGLSTLELHLMRCLRNGYDVSFVSDLTRPSAALPQPETLQTTSIQPEKDFNRSGAPE